MTKVLLVGSSHLGAVKLGWDQVGADYPSVQAEFFGAPAKIFGQMRLMGDGCFGLPPDSKVSEEDKARIEANFGRRSVLLTDHDAVFVIGWRIDEIVNAALLGDFAVAGLSEGEDRPPMSRPAYEALVDAHLGTLLPDPAWARLTAPPVWFVAKPRMSETALQGSSRRTRAWSDLMARKTVTPEGLGLFLARAEAVFAKAGLRLITPPPEVLASNGMTRAAFSRAGAPDGGRTSNDDFDHSHMNADYGAIMIHQIMGRLGDTQKEKTT